jgi:hypothetical protein
MKDDHKYLNSLFELGRMIYEKPALKKPEPGPIPDFDNPAFDPIIKLAEEIEIKEKYNLKLDKILHSEEGITIANEEVGKLLFAFKEKANFYNAKTIFNFRIQENLYNIIVSSSGFSVRLFWHQAFSNTLENSKLTLSYWYGSLVLDNYNQMYFPGDEPKRLKETIFSFDFDHEGKRVWRISINESKTTDQIVGESFAFIMESILKEKQKDFRK